MPAFLAFCSALVELMVSCRSPQAVAQECKIPLDQLAKGLQSIQPHYWSGKLAHALATPNYRLDLIAQLLELARLEEGYADLMQQLRNAKEIFENYNAKTSCLLPTLAKANNDAFRIRQAANRTIRDIQKARLAFEKAEKLPPSVDSDSQAASEPTAVAPRPQHDAKMQSQSPPQDQVQSLQQEQESSPPTIPNAAEPVTNTHSPAEEDFKALLFKHRERIKNTPAKDRPSLISRLIEQDRQKSLENRQAA
jgi:hypothetical protein